VGEDTKMYMGIIGMILAITAGVCAIIYMVKGYNQQYLDKGMIWVPATQGHWEMPKQPAEAR
jgi:hypothetical protein